MSDVTQVEGELLAALLSSGRYAAFAHGDLRLSGQGAASLAAVFSRKDSEKTNGTAVLLSSSALVHAEVDRADPGTVFFAIGPRGASLVEEASGLAERAWVQIVRLVPSEIHALTGEFPDGAAITRENVREVLVVEPRSELFRARTLPAPLVSDRFSIDDYRGLLLRAQANGYRFASFEDALALSSDDPAKVVLLRHDIDLSPTRALVMARVETSVGVRSTYFFMISGAYYDMLEPEHRKILREIAALGHQVGFHYDEYDDVAEGLEILSVVAGRTLCHIAQHNPTLLPRRSLDRSDIVDAYDPRIGGPQKFVYVSDSGMKWRQKTFADLLEEGCPRIYALCHPETWLTDGRDMIAMIRSVEDEEIARRRRRFDAFVESNIRYLRARREREGR